MRKIQVIAVVLILTQLVIAQSRDMVITKKDGSKSYVSVDAIDNIVFSAEQTGTVTDIDGNVYTTVRIGNQWWMAENLRVTYYRNGTEIPNVTDDIDWGNLSTGAYCYYPSNAATYGYLYNWYAVIRSDLAPAGWHVPTDEEWNTLNNFLGSDAGKKLKSTTGWNDYNGASGNGTDDYGFAALPAGYRYTDGNFTNMGNSATFWSATENSYDPWYRGLTCGNTKFYLGNSVKGSGLSVRLLRD